VDGTNSSVRFGIESSCRHPEFKDEVNRDALALYLRYNCIPLLTVFIAGSEAAAGDKGNAHPLEYACMPSPRSYWSVRGSYPARCGETVRRFEKEAIASLDALLRDAVKMRMVATCPSGILSGGVDSSPLCADAAAEPKTGETFSIVSTMKRITSNYAAAVAVTGDRSHDVLRLCRRSDEGIPHLPKFYDEPFSDSSQIPTYLVSALARR